MNWLLLVLTPPSPRAVLRGMSRWMGWGTVAAQTIGLGIVGKALVHGVVNGAVTAARGGRFLAGFAAGVIGKISGFVSQDLFGPAGSDNGLFFARTAVAAAGGCGGALIAKGSCGNGAVTAAFAHMYNLESSQSVSNCAFECRKAPIKNARDTDPYNYGSKDAAISKQVLELQLTAITLPFGGLGSLKIGSWLFSGAKHGAKGVSGFVKSSASSAFNKLFRPGSFLNSGRRFRIGMGGHGSRRVFRAGEDYVKKFNQIRGHPERGNKLFDIDIGPK